MSYKMIAQTIDTNYIMFYACALHVKKRVVPLSTDTVYVIHPSNMLIRTTAAVAVGDVKVACDKYIFREFLAEIVLHVLKQSSQRFKQEVEKYSPCGAFCNIMNRIGNCFCFYLSCFLLFFFACSR